MSDLTWIIEGLEKPGKTKSGLAAALGRAPSAVTALLKGGRQLKVSEVNRIAAYLEVEPPLATEPRAVPVVGYVGAGGEIYHHDAQGPFEYMPAPDGAGEKTVAVIIKGDSLGSLFEDWLVFYDDVRTPVTSDLVGKLCVIGLVDGRLFVKRLKRAKGGLFHLIGQFGDPILDVEVEWAARVKTMVPRTSFTRQRGVQNVKAVDRHEYW